VPAFQVGLADFRVGEQLLAGAREDDPAVRHDVAAMRKAQRVVGVLLDQEHGDPVARVDFPDHAEDLAHEQRREPERGFVEQQQLGPAHQRTPDGEHLLLAAGERAGALLAPLAQDRVEPAERPERQFVADAERLRAGPRQPGSEGYAARYLQDLTVNTVYDNGLGSSFKQVVIEVLTEEGARRYQQYSIQYDPSGQRVDVRLSRVLRRGGAIDQAVQRYDQSLSEPWYSLYYDLRADVVVFPRLQVGDVIELQYRVDDVAHRNLFADYYGDITFLQNVEPRQNVGYVLVTPAARSFYFQEPRLAGLEKRVDRNGETRTYSFRAKNVPAVSVEERMPGFAEVAAYVHVSTYQSWQDVGHWYWGLVRDQFQADDALKATVRRLVDGIESPRARARRGSPGARCTPPPSRAAPSVRASPSTSGGAPSRQPRS